MTMKRGGKVIVLVLPPSECEQNAIVVQNEVLLPTPTLSVGVGRIFESVCLFVCLSVCHQHNSKTNDFKVFKLGVWNDLVIY